MKLRPPPFNPPPFNPPPFNPPPPPPPPPPPTAIKVCSRCLLPWPVGSYGETWYPCPGAGRSSKMRWMRTSYFPLVRLEKVNQVDVLGRSDL